MFRALYPLKPAPEIVRDDRPELGVFGGELEVRPIHCASVRVPLKQLDVVPTIQNPGLHVGSHDDPLEIGEVHVPSVPPVGAETLQALLEHEAVSEMAPLAQDLVPVAL